VPPILELKNHELIKDDDGNVLDLGMVGERDINKCYFRVNVSRSGNSRNQKLKIYLTYSGFMKMIHVSRSSKVNKFMDWANKIIYTAHIGTKSQKRNQASKMLGVNQSTIKQALDKSARCISCVYLMSLGMVSELRSIFDISDEYNDNNIVYTFGRTKDLVSRMAQHTSKYGKLGREVGLVNYADIDPIYNVDAENDIKRFFTDNNYRLLNKKYVELVVLSKSDMGVSI